MTFDYRWPVFAFAALALIATGCSDSDDDGDGDRVCMDGSRPLSSTGVCENAGEPGDPCENNWDCVPGSICYNASYCVGTGALRVTLSFETDSDFDLHVLTPGGAEIYYDNQVADGGELDVDQCIGACGTETHVENVVFQGAASGTYEIWVVNFDGRATGPFSIEVFTDAGVEDFHGELPAEADAESERFTISL